MCSSDLLGREGAAYTEAGIMWQAIIHAIFILSAIGIAVVDWISQQTGAAPRGGHH